MTCFTDVLAQIAPRQTGVLRFVGDSLQPQQRIFGGQVVAQCLMAANQTVSSDLGAHSLHAYFLRAGDPEIPIEFEVDPIRNGRSFSTRRVVARQRGEAIFNTSISYHVQEDGVSHSFDMPPVSPPRLEADDLSGFRGFTTKTGDPNLIELYQLERQRVTQYLAEEQPPVGRSWFRAVGPLPDDKAVHQAALVMISDYSLLSTMFYPHPYSNPIKHFMAASLDHALWFHHAGKIDDWVLYDCDTPRAGGGRGFSRGFLWAQDGTLIASTAQESLMRLKRD
ncbi:MAG: thioesterase family protein [Luminiphilus sp.]|nr:thioesterase family protein [Luminiphilus sp.]